MKRELYFFIAFYWIVGMSIMLFYPAGYHTITYDGSISYYDKLWHLIMFGVLTYLVLSIGIKWKREQFFWIVIFTLFFSIAFNFTAEYLQMFVPGRDTSSFDFLAGVLGTTAAIPITYAFHYRPRRKAVLHVCCAPCATAVREMLNENYRLEFLFSNSNIHPRSEYLKRLREVKKLAAKFGIKVRGANYDHDDWKKTISGFENDPEGSTRCRLCFLYRLREAARCAKKNKIPVFATTLSISPHKNFSSINKIGSGLGKMAGVEFLNFDFKKNNGFGRSVKLSKKFKLYRQKYCGCEFSNHDADLQI